MLFRYLWDDVARRKRSVHGRSSTELNQQRNRAGLHVSRVLRPRLVSLSESKDYFSPTQQIR